METACSWLFDTLDTTDGFPLQLIYERHIDENESFHLSDVLSFLPEKDLPKLVALIKRILSLTLSCLQTRSDENNSDIRNAHHVTVRAASEVVSLLLKQRKTAAPILNPLIFALHDAFLDLPTDSQETVSTIGETLWHADDAERNRVVPCTMLHFLQKSFGEESGFRCGQNRRRLPGTVSDIRRVYTMRKSLETLELAETSPGAETIRHLLMRCATSSAYLKTSDGRKFLAYLLTLNDVKASTFETLLNHLATVRKSFANLFGTVFLYAWKSKREEWLAERLMTLAERAIQAGSEPFSTNLRVVLSTFHANKRVTGVDLLLNDIYSPVLFRNLMVANPLVRRNALIVLCDAFPIHDPGAGVQDIERSMEVQCGKLLDLLQDPCTTVRLTAIEGSCRVLGLFWELVSSSFTKRVVDLLTAQMAFDTSSPRIRITVFEGLKFLLENHLSHQVLSIALPRLSSLVHDRVERVRLSFLDLLLAVKGKRMRSLRYFDIVEINSLLLRLPTESPAVTAKIMELIRTSYFPLKRKQKTAEELAESQTRACLSMLNSNSEAARQFYRHLYLHVAPGPLLEFAMRLSLIAINAPKGPTRAPDKSRKTRKKKSRSKENKTVTTNPRKGMSLTENDENVPPSNELQEKSEDQEDYSSLTTTNPVDGESILIIVAEVLVSISTSLQKEANRELQKYLDDVLGGEALRPLLLERGNSLARRAACWRIASCLSGPQVEPLTATWQEQMRSISEWYSQKSSELQGHKDLVSALMLCGLKWDLLPSLSSFFDSWCDATVNGSRAIVTGMKAPKRNQRRKEPNRDLRCAMNPKNDVFMRERFLFSLWVCGDVILTSENLQEGILRKAMSSGQNLERGDIFCVLAPLRKACVGVLDFFLETFSMSRERKDIDALLHPRFILQALTTTWRVCLKFATCGTDSHNPLTEIRQLMQWFCSSQVWKSAFAMSNRFATALATVCLAHCADTVAVTNLTDDDLCRYEAILNAIRHELVFSSTLEEDQMIAEALRLSFLLREQALYTAANPEADFRRSTKLRNTSNALLSMICETLSNVKSSSDENIITFSKLTRHEQFLRDITLDMHHAEDMQDFRLAFAKSLTVSFETESRAEEGLFPRLICKIVGSQIINKKGRGSLLGFRLYDSIVRCFRSLEDRFTSDQCIGNFTKILVDCMFSHYNENEQDIKPSDSARECFAKMGSLVEKEFPQLNTTEGEEDSNLLLLREAQKNLSLLRNMGEEDVENKGEMAGTVITDTM